VVRCGTWFRQANQDVYRCLLTESDHTAGSGEVSDTKTNTTPWTSSQTHYVWLVLYNAASVNYATAPTSCYVDVNTTPPASVDGGMASGKYTLLAHFAVTAAGHIDGEIQQDWTGGNIFDAWTFFQTWEAAQDANPCACFEFIQTVGYGQTPAERRAALLRWLDRTYDAAPNVNARIPFQDSTNAAGYGALNWCSPTNLMSTLITIWPESGGVPVPWPGPWPIPPHGHTDHNAWATDDHKQDDSTTVSWTGAVDSERPGYAMLGKLAATSSANQWGRNSVADEDNYLGNSLQVEMGVVAWAATGTGLEVKSNTPASGGAGSILTAGGINAALESWIGTGVLQVKLGGATYAVDVSGGNNMVRVGAGGKYVVDTEEFAPYECIVWKPGTNPPEPVLIHCLAREP
jgi:hypothetical protein